MSLVGFLGELRDARGLSKAELGRRMASMREARGGLDSRVTRNDVFRWESGEVRIRIEDVADWLTVVGASAEQRLHALSLASGGHSDHQAEPIRNADELPPRAAASTMPTSAPEVQVSEVSDRRPVVGICRRSSCRGPLHALVDGDVWLKVKCDDCELETDLERARPAVEAVEGAHRWGAA